MTKLTWPQQIAARQKLVDAGAYSTDDERDNCGVGLIVSTDGVARREIVELAIKSLKAVWHRGAVDADGKTGDGAGVRLNIPQDLFRGHVARTGHTAEGVHICVGQVFLPRTDFSAQDASRAIVEDALLKAGFSLYGWRQVPVDASHLGEKANATRPQIEQVLFHDPREREVLDRERALYVVRRKIEKTANEKSLADLYVCSLSGDDLIYKGMSLAEDIDLFYPDLQDPQFISRFAIFHQRYSTNTFPQWRLAQPFRVLAHNGEINTIKGNINWMRSHETPMASAAFGDDAQEVKPIIQPGSSDSGALDQVWELLVRAGRSGPMAKCLLMPEAWSKRAAIVPAAWSAMYEHCNSVMEPWDGPAAVAAYDGRWAVAGLDRNGLRPMRYAITSDNVLAVGSETGMSPLDPAKVIRRGALDAGAMIAFDFKYNKLFTKESILDELASRHPYEEWLENVIELESEIGPGEEERLFDGEELQRRQVAAGYSLEEIDSVIKPMAMDGKEAIGSMGDDTPIAVLSKKYRPLSHFFRQKFSQVTNPPIDPLREARVMSLKTRFKNLGNILDADATQSDVYVLESPFLSNGMYDRFTKFVKEKSVQIDCCYQHQAGLEKGANLRAGINRIKLEVQKAVEGGAQHIVLTDEAVDAEHIAIPMIIAVGAAHSHLTQEGLRTYCSIIVRSAECIDPHYVGVLVSAGATAVCPYLACESIAFAQEKGRLGDISRGDAILNYKRAIEAGLLKILSKSGISVISAFRGGCNFEALGLSRALTAEFFPGAISRISGIGLAGLEGKVEALHSTAFAGPPPVVSIGGFYKHRRRGEKHALEAGLVEDLQTAVRNEDYTAYKRYSETLAAQDPLQLRDLLEMRAVNPPKELSEVEAINSIRKRFVTPGMSLGALSPEAHGALNIAMNRIGARSVSGEGGEDPARYRPHANGDNENSAIKQIASGRFGVTAEYLNQCREIEIKVAQGAKPGEGGQLPGFKVTEFIAKMRHSTPGVTLISPPPHHDIYSIEDLAQLIYDLKNINPDARVCVKLVATAGIGAIAAGVAKAKADIILISGNVGGTGASPLTSIKFAGSPWELGLSEAHQVLTINNLRSSVTLRTDGGIRTGRDVVLAAMLGAEEYGVGTISLVALGCLMVRQCHSNTCPVGVCTQDEDLRNRFPGLPDHVVTLMSFIAEEVREILADLGFTKIEDVIGRTDLLHQVHRGAPDLDDLDLNPILTRVDTGDAPIYSTREGRNEPAETLDVQILKDAEPVFERREKMQLTYAIENIHRSIGARTSSAIVRTFGAQGLPQDHLTVRLRGSAGQSLGAFSATGLKLVLDGDANDYVGKGLSGATLVVRPRKPLRRDVHEDAIIGNTCLYGATSGTLYAAGQAGGRFAVRNSGANAVIEGCASNGCEYMTGGIVVILGAVGDNFGAGMTGGLAYVLDQEKKFPHLANADDIISRAVPDDRLASLRAMIEEHQKQTGSLLAAEILDDWATRSGEFLEIVPKEALALEKSPVEIRARS